MLDGSVYEDELPYYLALIENNVDVNISTVIQLCQYRPQRVRLLIQTSNQAVWVSSNPNIVAAATNTAQQGIFLSGTTLPINFNAIDDPLLTQHDWYGVEPGTGNIAHMTVIETVIREWPKKGTPAYEAIKSIIRPGSGSNGISRDTRAKPTSLWDMVFSACRSKGNRSK